MGSEIPQSLTFLNNYHNLFALAVATPPTLSSSSTIPLHNYIHCLGRRCTCTTPVPNILFNKRFYRPLYITHQIKEMHIGTS